MTNVREYLEFMANIPGKDEWPYHNVADFILKEGQEFHESECPEVMGEKKGCFKNAFELMLTDDELTYVEGYAIGYIIPVLHAWCVNEDGMVVDPTWKCGFDYFGVKFDQKFVTRFTLRRGRFGVIDSWDVGFPLLSGQETGWRLTAA